MGTGNNHLLKLSRNLLISLMLVALLISPLVVLAQDDDNTGKKMKADKATKKVSLSMDGFQIEVNAGGQVPFYHFNTSVAKFFFKFQKIIQFADANGNSVYDAGEEIKGPGGIVSLPSITWDLFILEDTEESKVFSFNSSQIQQAGFENAEIDLVNHFDGTNPAVKFDVIISNWPFATGATGLALEFELIWTEESNLIKETTDNTITVKDSDGVVQAYFEIVSDIIVDGSEISNGAQMVDTSDVEATKLNIHVNYPVFSSSLEHDPTLGTSYSAIGGDANPSTIFQQVFGDLDARNVIGGFAVITVLTSLAVLSLVWINKKKK